MARPLRPTHFFFTINLRRTALLATLLTLVTGVASPARGQTFRVIHSFTGADGQSPYAGLTMDAAGRLYGTTYEGGSSNSGTVFRLVRSGSGWVLAPLYSFAGGSDGACPWARVIFGPDGSLYGTASQGGGAKGNGCHERGYGAVFSLRPPATACKTALCLWTKTNVHTFGGKDGYQPIGDLTFDSAGNLYGTTYNGGRDGVGTVYELAYNGVGWAVNVLYTFSHGETLFLPSAGVTFDKAGNLYGTAEGGFGGAFELTPSGGGWVYNEVYALHGGVQGGSPRAGLIFDDAGNLYSATMQYGTGGGTAFELTPVNGSWAFSLLYSFIGVCCNQVGPWATLVMDSAGNLYGTTYADGAYGLGSVFKLTRGTSQWTYTSLHDFTGGDDGANPISNVVFDENGNLYGTTSAGGSDACSSGCGVVWEITP